MLVRTSPKYVAQYPRACTVSYPSPRQNIIATPTRPPTPQNQALARQCITLEGVLEKQENLRGAVTIGTCAPPPAATTTPAINQHCTPTPRLALKLSAYPMGLPEYDGIHFMLSGGDTDIAMQGATTLDSATAKLWWAGKEFVRGETVGDRVGKNEKTKVVVKLQANSGGPPAREAAVSEDERKAMMAFWFKKNEEAKALADNDEDDFLHSSWANPRALKTSLTGTDAVKWRPGM